MVEDEIDEYVPGRGDVVWLTSSPTRGHEQGGRRPALVLSSERYNGKVGLALVCPITRQSKGYPFEVRIEDNPDVKGVILSDHARSVDWRERSAEFICTVPSGLVNRVGKTLNRVLDE
jgi:mRNA interferase MazF